MKRIVTGLTIILLAASLSCAAQNDRKHIVMKRATPAADKAPFSEAVLVSDTLFVGGHIGLDPSTGKPGDTPEAEAKLVMEAVKRTIEAGGMTMDDLVSVTVFCPDLSNYAKFNDVYRTYFKKEFPARAFIGRHRPVFPA